MTNRNYKRGAALEYRMKDKLEKDGWFVVRAAGSHGVADLVAIKFASFAHHILLVSCKLSEYAPPGEIAALQQKAQELQAVPMITTRGKGNQWVLTPL